MYLIKINFNIFNDSSKYFRIFLLIIIILRADIPFFYIISVVIPCIDGLLFNIVR